MSRHAISTLVCAISSATLLAACSAAESGPSPPVSPAPVGGGGGSAVPTSAGGGAGAGGAGAGATGAGGAGAGGAGAGATGAGGESGACGDVPTTYFASTCTFVVCHVQDSGTNPLDLLSPGLPQRLVGVASTSSNCNGLLYIDPQAPEQSLLVRKLDADRPCGDRMPPPAMATPAERACVLGWIKAAVALP